MVTILHRILECRCQTRADRRDVSLVLPRKNMVLGLLQTCSRKRADQGLCVLDEMFVAGRYKHPVLAVRPWAHLLVCLVDCVPHV